MGCVRAGPAVRHLRAHIFWALVCPGVRHDSSYLGACQLSFMSCGNNTNFLAHDEMHLKCPRKHKCSELLVNFKGQCPAFPPLLPYATAMGVNTGMFVSSSWPRFFTGESMHSTSHTSNASLTFCAHRESLFSSISST